MPTSAEFWALAEVRLEDAEGLLGIKRWACAFYVAGYAVTLEKEFGTARGANPALDNHWQLVTGWKETSRYQRRSQQEAEALVQAINHDPDGVMKWIRGRW